MLNNKLKPIAIAVGAAFAGSLASVALADAETDLFAADELDRSYDLVAEADGGGDGSCGDGSCGDKDDDSGGDGDSGDDSGGDGDSGDDSGGDA